uniref:JmjC domain-containing protein n=1 Tax=Phaeomonas parva TaxID=124430 RepID=A0A7S1U632_9STRA|mmetsp:Transcript_29967/g.95755  ORF Transcript_29967/g.95755 Transcript_29967/m.95755 type:complete len:482 (+) Transcript_29967:345-1790(+)
MRRRPVLIRGAPEAPQLQWQWQQLVEALPLLEDVRLRDAGAGGVFTLRGERDRGGMLEDPSPDATASVPAVATRRFLETAADPSLFLYWTKDAEVLDGSPLALRAADGGAASNATEAAWRRWAVKEVQLERDDFGGAAIDELIMPMLWLSQPGVVAQAHYDKSHNFVTQVLGNKRWLIFPPFQHFRLYQYPHLHPSYKQSQVDFAAPDLKRFPSFRGAQALEAEVGPGDVLYMPPYWFHRVETTEMSLSLSVVSPSEEELVLSEAYWKDMPLGSLEGKTERTLGARRYLLEVLARLRGVKSPRWFADRLYEQRYAALFPEASLLMQEKLAAFDCHLAETDPLTGARLESTVRNSLPREELEATADFVAECANDDVIPPAVREQWAQSYVEEIARWARGDPEEAVLFIRKCLSDDEHVKVPEQVEWVEGPEVIKIGENAMEGDWIEPAERRRLERRKRARERAKAGKQKPGQQKPKKKHAEL